MKSIKNYDQALEYLGSKNERPYAHNTRIERIPAGDVPVKIVVKYHGNIVTQFYPEYTTFSSCGWKTITTKERINWFLPEGFHLWQEKSIWYITDRNEGKRYNFADGITITDDGQVFNYAPESEAETTKRQIKAIKVYVAGYIKALFDGEIPAPSGGDCWVCLMSIPGDNVTHIESHIEESYYVPSLIMRAYDHNKRLSQLARGTIAQIWQGTTTGDIETMTQMVGDLSAWQKDITPRDIKTCLTAYLKHCLGIAQ